MDNISDSSCNYWGCGAARTWYCCGSFEHVRYDVIDRYKILLMHIGEVKMNTWILIIMMHVGVLGDGNSNALTSVAGFESREACVKAGDAASKLASNTVKEIKFVCASSK